MKKIAIILIGLCLSTAALADESIRIINDDKEATMSLSVQKCNDIKGTVSCPLTMAVTLVNQQYVDLMVPPAFEHAWWHIANVAATVKGREVATGKYQSEKKCSAMTSGDIIILDSHATDIVACNDRNFGEKNK